MKNKVLPIITVVLSLLAAIGPFTIFPVCESGEMKMKCYYTARWELAIGIAAALIGIALLFIAKSKIKAILAGAQIALGALIILIPTVIIGVCGSPMMRCVTVTKPALVLIGTLHVVTSVFILLVSIREIVQKVRLKVA